MIKRRRAKSSLDDLLSPLLPRVWHLSCWLVSQKFVDFGRFHTSVPGITNNFAEPLIKNAERAELGYEPGEIMAGLAMHDRHANRLSVKHKYIKQSRF